MAQSKSFYDDIKKEIECPVCQEQFSDINEPKVLKCQHTFCKSCLEGWFRQQRGRTLSCPTCREITECPNNNINSLPSNLAYMNLGDILKAHSKTGGHDFVSERENVCKCHKEKIKFYCEQCAICICSDCIIIEHRDRNYHNIMSLEEGARKQKAIIERNMRQVAVNTSRLRSYTSSLEKRKAKADKSIDQATKELHRVVNSCINSLRRHEASVTELLTTEKSSYDDAFAKQLFELTKKIQGMDNLSAQSKDVLQRNNLQEMLNITQVLDERIVKEETLLLNCPEFKYIPNDALSLNLAPGKLYITNTEPTGLNNVCACAGCHDNISKISARTRCVVLLSFTTEWRKWSREFPFIIESNVCIPSFYSDKSYFEHFKAHNEVFFENKCPVIRQNFICNWWHLRD